MHKSEFHFDLPESLIAEKPCDNRADSRLLVVDPVSKQTQDKLFFQIIEHIQPNDCLIFNNTKVIPARLAASRETGGKVEVLLERITPAASLKDHDSCIAQLRASNTPKQGAKIIVNDDFILQVTGREGAFFKLECLSESPLLELIEQYGQMPLPPYIQRQAGEFDKSRYQTVYAQKQGAVAAPTAGLHFDQALIQKLKQKGVAMDFVTLHVGAGTFAPIRVDNILEHQMHSEWYEVGQSVVDLVNQTRANGGRVISVGTTSIRCLESASQTGNIQANSGETDIFIYPGYEFKSVDALITNFHLSESTLMMLVSAFAGKDFMLASYQHAIKQEYRFFSYGDAMFIENKLSEGHNK
jgi:S-adenosylmethionine:tRNA ribosyltransferase-isomerase